MIELPGGGRLYTEDEPMPTVEELIASMTPEWVTRRDARREDDL